MIYNKIMKGIFTGFLLLFCIGGVYGAVITVDDFSLTAGESKEFPISLDVAPTGLAGYKIAVTFENPNTAAITDVIFPNLWPLNSVDPDVAVVGPVSSVTVSGVDLQHKVEAGARDIELCSLTIISRDGTANRILLNVIELTDDAGSAVDIGVPAPTPGPTGTQTQAPVPTVTQTQAPEPTVTQTQAPVPTVTQTQAPEPTVTQTQAPEPTLIQPPIPGQLVAAFTSDKTFGTAPLTIHFTDMSRGNPDTYFWEFGDGEVWDGEDAISVVQNPQYTYRKPGIYNVRLTVSKGGQTDTTVLATDIIIGAPRPIPVKRVNGILSIGSIPQGADLYLNGAYYGKTPKRIEDLTPHTYQVRLKMPGYYDSVTTIPVWKGPMPSYAAAIFLKAVPPNVGKVAADPPQTGSTYIVTYPEGVNVYLNDLYVGTSDLMITRLPVGTYDITLKREGFADWPGKVQILVGKTVMQVYHYEYPTYEPVQSQYFKEPEIAEGDE